MTAHLRRAGVTAESLARAMWESDPDCEWNDLDEQTQRERVKEAAALLEAAIAEQAGGDDFRATGRTLTGGLALQPAQPESEAGDESE